MYSDIASMVGCCWMKISKFWCYIFKVGLIFSRLEEIPAYKVSKLWFKYFSYLNSNIFSIKHEI